jgi:formate dehydrogenase maturation protein FdhE
VAQRDQVATQIAESKWEQRIERAELLALDAGRSAVDVLRFYAAIARVQQNIYETLPTRIAGTPTIEILKERQSLELLGPGLRQVCATVKEHGPKQLANHAEDLLESGRLVEVLVAYWEPEQDALDRFFARTVLQAAAERLAAALTPPEKYESGTCPFCGCEPAVGVMRPEGLGAKRALLCSFCATEWNFPRIKCPSCGEDRNHQLPVYTPEDQDYVRIDACDTCKTYLKTVDLSKMGVAVPVVDEIASLRLTLWAEEKGYHKLAGNLMGM